MNARERLGAVGRLLAQVDTAAPAERERTRALVHELLEAHRAGLAAVLAELEPAQLARLCDDADCAALLMLHSLHPVALETRVARAVDTLAPRLAAEHAQLRLLGVDADGRVRLGLEHGGRMGALHAAIEEALATAAADASEVLIDEQVVAPMRFAPGSRGTGG